MTRSARHSVGRIFTIPNPRLVGGMALVIMLGVLAIASPLLSGWDYRTQDLQALREHDFRALPPFSPTHLFGTDQLGRDLLTRVLDGARISVIVAFVAQVSVLLIGLPVGAIAGWSGGRIDNVLMRLADVFFAFPQLLILIVVRVAFLDTDLGNALDGMLVIFLAIGLTSWMGLARLVRARVLELKEREFVDAARAIGVGEWRILLRHVGSNATSLVLVAVSLGLPAAILAESTLSFLGLGVQLPRASWGSLLAEAAADPRVGYWQILLPAIALALAMLAFTLLGDGLRDALDPRRRRR